VEDRGEWMEERAVGIFEEGAKSVAIFLRLEDGVEGVDIGDAVWFGEGAVEEDVGLCMALGLTRVWGIMVCGVLS